MRTADTVARLGGDEFAVLLEDTDTESARDIAGRIQDAMAPPAFVQGHELSIRTSIGVAPAEASARTSDVLREADIAMYAAKRDGKDRCRIFSPEMRSSVITRMQLQAELNEALTLEQFVLHYQPVIQQQTGRLEAVETLLRWNHPQRGLLQPADFISLAEDTGLIVPLGVWVTKEATRQAKALQEALDIRLSVSVHLSAQQLTSDIVGMVSGALAESQLDPGDLTLEIAEMSLIAEEDVMVTQLQALRALGVRIAIDNFGYGYSSPGYLRRLPVDILKIDRSFIDRITDGREASALTEAIINLARTLGLRTIAEGIETAEQAQALQDFGCHSAQGYHFYPPLPAEQLLGFHHSRTMPAATMGVVVLKPAIRAGQWMTFAERLRSQPASRLTGDKVTTLAELTGIDAMELQRLVLPELKKLGVVDYVENTHGDLVSVEEYLGIGGSLLTFAARLFEALGPSCEQRATVMSGQLAAHAPMTERDHLDAPIGTGFDEPTARKAMNAASSVRLIKRQRSTELRTNIIYNEHVWSTTNIVSIAGFLQNLPSDERGVILGLVSEAGQRPGVAIDKLATKSSSGMLKAAKSVGLIDSVTVQGATQHQTYAFSPLMEQSLAASDQTDALHERKLFVAHILFGHEFGHASTGRIRDPVWLVDRLLKRGKVGPATAITNDYAMPEAYGIVRVERRLDTMSTLHVVKKDVINDSLSFLTRTLGSGTTTADEQASRICGYLPEFTFLKKSVAA